MKVLGIIMILGSIVFTTWWIITKNNNKSSIFSLCLIVIFVGLIFIYNERITEFTVGGVGTIKAAVLQAETDVETISTLKERVEN